MTKAPDKPFSVQAEHLADNRDEEAMERVWERNAGDDHQQAYEIGYTFHSSTKHLLKQMIGPVSTTTGSTFRKTIAESGYMSRCLKNFFRSHSGAMNLDNISTSKPMIPPSIEESASNRSTIGAIINEA